MSTHSHAAARPSAFRHPDWVGYRHALLQSLYALPVLLTLLLPANFIAYALSVSTNGGSALGGIKYGLDHHLAGHFVTSAGHATMIDALAWWAGAIWEGLFWLSCAGAVALFALWVGRVALVRLWPGARGRDGAAGAVAA